MAAVRAAPFSVLGCLEERGGNVLDPRDCRRGRVGWEVRCEEGEVWCVADDEGSMLRVEEPCEVWCGRVDACGCRWAAGGRGEGEVWCVADDEGGMLRVEEPCEVWCGRVDACGRCWAGGCGGRHDWVSS
jgi:hypothetical protein